MREIETLGGVIKFARQSKHLTQKELSEKLMVTPRYLKYIENSDQKPSYKLMVRIINELGIPAEMMIYPENKNSRV